MSRNAIIFASCALGLFICLPARAQDSPSLGDLARQAQKDKTNAPAKKVYTNDDLPSASTPGASGSTSALGTGLGQIAQPAQPAAPSKQTAPASPSDQLDHLESILNQLASLDRATLVKSVLQGADANFPGSDAWETKLMAAKNTYVTEGRALLQKARRIETLAGSLQGVDNPNDPRVKDLSNQLQQIAEDGVRIDASFQAVMMEGRDLAGQSSPK